MLQHGWVPSAIYQVSGISHSLVLVLITMSLALASGSGGPPPRNQVPFLAITLL